MHRIYLRYEHFYFGPLSAKLVRSSISVEINLAFCENVDFF